MILIMFIYNNDGRFAESVTRGVDDKILIFIRRDGTPPKTHPRRAQKRHP